MKFVLATVSALFMLATTAYSSTIGFSATFTGVVMTASFSDTFVFLEGESPDIDLSRFTSEELGFDDSFLTGLDKGEIVSGTINLSLDMNGLVRGDCFFTGISYNFCGVTEDFKQLDNGSSSFEFGRSFNQKLVLSPKGVFGGMGVFSYQDDALYSGRLPNGTFFSSGGGGGFNLGVNLTYSVVSEIPLPASASLLLSIFALPFMKKLRRKNPLKSH